MKLSRFIENLQSLEALPVISKLPLSSKEKQLVGLTFFFLLLFLIAYITVLVTWKRIEPTENQSDTTNISTDSTGPLVNSETIEAFKNSANYYFDKDSLYESGTYIEKFLQADSTPLLYHEDTLTDYQIKLTKILQELGLQEKAHLYLSQLISDNPNNIQLAYIELENTPDGELTPLTEEPRFQSYLSDETYLARFVGRYIEVAPEKAKMYIDALIKQNSEHSDISYLLSRYHTVSKTERNSQKALTTIKSAVKKNPLNGQYRSELGFQLYLKEDYENALKELQIAIQLLPDNPTAHFNLGQLYQKQFKSPEKAATHYEKAIDLKPRHWKSHFELGLVYLQLNELDKAVSSLRSASRLKPGDLRIFLQLAAAYERTHENELAFSYYYDSILSLEKTNEIALYKLSLPPFSKLRAERDLSAVASLLDTKEDTSTSIAILNGILAYDKYNIEAKEMLKKLANQN